MATDQLGAFLTRRTAWTSSIETAKLPRCSDGRRLPHVSMECDHAPLARIFWSILAIEIIGFGVMMISAARTGGHTPEGPVGGWLIFIPPVFWAVLALLFYGTDSSSKRLTYTVLLALPLIQALVGPIYGTVQNVWWERGRAGADYFSAAPLRLANAIYDHDVERVIRLIPAAGDLNTPHGNGMTLFDFAMSNTDDSDASLEIIRAMLTAGGNANVPPGRPLTLALYRALGSSNCCWTPELIRTQSTRPRGRCGGRSYPRPATMI